MSDTSPPGPPNAPHDSPSGNDASDTPAARRRSSMDATAYTDPTDYTGFAAIALACGWLLVPAAQYFGAFQRTSLQLEGAASSPELAKLDLTSIYMLLVALTLFLALFRWLSRPRGGMTPLTECEAEP